MLQRESIGYGTLSNLKALLVVILVAGSGIGATMVATGWESFEVPLEPADAVVIRISGTEGLPFGGSYATVGTGQRSVEGELGLLPTEYEVPVGAGVGFARFEKQVAEGDLEAEILVNGEVLKERETSAEYGVVTMTYSPQGSPDRPRHPLEPSIPFLRIASDG